MTIIDYGKIFYARRWPIIILMVAIIGFTLVNTFFTEKTYTAKAVVFPTTINQGGIASFLSSSLAGIVKQDANVMVVLFKSQSIAENVAQKLGLESRFKSNIKKESKAERLERAAAFLQNKIKASVNKDGAIEVDLEMEDPDLAENIVGAYIIAVSECLAKNTIPINFVIIDPAKASSQPSSPNLKMNLLAALFVSMVLGILFSLLDDYFHAVLKQ